MKSWWIMSATVIGAIIFEIIRVAMGAHVTRELGITWLAICLVWVGIAGFYRNMWERR